MQEVPPAFFLVDKPVGPTSFKMVQLIKRALQIKKVGHSGTLDPFASGLLIICAGRAATKQISVLMESEKEYVATLKLGVETDSQDLTGEIISRNEVIGLSWQVIEKCLLGFVGEQLQQPPAFSALKYKGKPLYYYARKGIKIKKEPRPILIKELEGLSWQDDLVRIRVVCSKGTYVRTLASDIGKTLGCGAHLVELRRVRCGGYSVEGAISGESLDQDREIARALLLKNMLPADSGIAA